MVNEYNYRQHDLPYATGLFAIFVGTSSVGGTMYYTLKDHQGSLAATVHGNTVERLSYDPWGRRRNTTDFGYDNVTYTFDRGYTLHEHYNGFGLINMNGRLYDPILGRMLSPDVVIQDEQSSQAYNRYSYCFNNPVMFVDPTGLTLKTGNGRHRPDDPPPYVYVEGVGGYMISEVVITPQDVPWEEFDYTPYSPTSSGFTNGNNLNAGNANGTSITPGSSGGGNIGGGTKHSTPDNTNNKKKNDNIDIVSKTLTSINIYTIIESSSYYNLNMRTWRDKLDVVRSMDYHGNQYSGGMNSFGKMMSKKFKIASGWLNGIGIGLSVYELMTTENLDGKIEYGSDIIVGCIGFVPGGGIISTFWFLGGRELVFLNGATAIEMMENGYNPGLIQYQPFK